jgi:hypothetical protein
MPPSGSTALMVRESTTRPSGDSRLTTITVAWTNTVPVTHRRRGAGRSGLPSESPVEVCRLIVASSCGGPAGRYGPEMKTGSPGAGTSEPRPATSTPVAAAEASPTAAPPDEIRPRTAKAISPTSSPDQAIGAIGGRRRRRPSRLTSNVAPSGRRADIADLPASAGR